MKLLYPENKNTATLGRILTKIARTDCFFQWIGLLLLLQLLGCSPPPPATATILVTLDMGSGGAGFAATIYVQEVSSGKTFSAPYSAGSHGLVVLPTSAPVGVTVDAPGVYVVYARLVNDPDSYHYGATGCGPAQNCPNAELLAFEIEPGETIPIVIADRAPQLPARHQPVTVPWRLAETPTPAAP